MDLRIRLDYLILDAVDIGALSLKTGKREDNADKNLADKMLQ